MSTDCVTATLQDNVYELAVLMKKHNIGFIPIVDGSNLIGVVTDRDLVVKGYAEKHSGSTAVETVMTKNIDIILRKQQQRKRSKQWLPTKYAVCQLWITESW